MVVVESVCPLNQFSTGTKLAPDAVEEQNPSSYWIILEARKALDAAEKQSPVASGKG